MRERESLRGVGPRRPRHFKFLNSRPLWILRCPRLQKPTECFQRCVRHVMLDSFGISFSSLARYAQCEKYVNHKPMARSHPSSQLPSTIREKHTTIRASCCHPLSLQAGDGLNDGGMGNAQAVGNICRTCLTRGGQQISDELNIILKQSCGLSRTSLAEAMRLGELGGELCQRRGSFSHHRA